MERNRSSKEKKYCQSYRLGIYISLAIIIIIVIIFVPLRDVSKDTAFSNIANIIPVAVSILYNLVLLFVSTVAIYQSRHWWMKPDKSGLHLNRPIRIKTLWFAACMVATMLLMLAVIGVTAHAVRASMQISNERGDFFLGPPLTYSPIFVNFS